MEKVWEIKDPDALLRDMEQKRTGKKRLSRQPGEEKDPARAYTLSLLYWGGGQLYNDQLGKGAAFMVLMLLFIAGSIFSAARWDTVLTFLVLRDIPLARALLAAQIFLLIVLLFWAYNASDAYHGAVRMRRAPFTGTASTRAPLICSMLMPGWGQFLNGQPVKGGIFAGLAVLEAFAVLSAVSTFLAWPFLEASDVRYVLEGVSAVSILALPPLPLLWMLSSYDAYSVSSDDLYKEPLRERLRAAYYRGRTQGWVRGIFPNIRLTFLLILLLVFFLFVVHNWFPSGYYARMLSALQSVLRDRGMTILPEFIGNLLAFMAKWIH